MNKEKKIYRMNSLESNKYNDKLTNKVDDNYYKFYLNSAQ